MAAGAGGFVALRNWGAPGAGPGPLVAVVEQTIAPEPVVLAAAAPAKAPEAPLSPPKTLPEAPLSEPVSAPKAGNALAEGRKLFEAGELVSARKMVNEAFVSGRLSGSDTAAARELLSTINQQVLLGKKIFKDDPFTSAYTVQPGDRLTKVASSNNITWELLCRVNGISDPRKVRAMQTLKLVKGPFHAVVSKKQFIIDMYLGAPGGEGAMYAMSFPVGLGKDDSTPLGTWKVEPQRKLKNPTYYSPRGEGIIAADDPKNPLGEFWIGLAGVEGQAVGKSSYGIHGTIDPQSIGKEESMGCIRLKNEDVAVVFELLVEGKSMVVVGE